MSPTLSVVCPNYNYGAYIGKTIESVLSQTRRPDEFIIVDDCSTDDSAKVIEKYRNQNPWITLIKNNSNLGAVKNCNKAFGLATGDYIYGIASDDIIYPDFFKQAMKLSDQFPQAGTIMGEVASVDDNGKFFHITKIRRWRKPLYASPQKYIRDVLFGEYPGLSLSSATIYKRSCLLEAGDFRTDLGGFCDTYRIHSIILKYGCCYLPYVSSGVWRHGTSFASAISADPYKMLDIIARAAHLLRSKDISAAFPMQKIIKWEMRYRKWAIYDALRLKHKRVFNELNQKGKAGKLLSYILNLLSYVWCRIPFLPEKKLLQKYKANLANNTL